MGGGGISARGTMCKAAEYCTERGNSEKRGHTKAVVRAASRTCRGSARGGGGGGSGDELSIELLRCRMTTSIK